MKETENQPQDLPEYLREEEPDQAVESTFLSEDSIADSPATPPADSTIASTPLDSKSEENPVPKVEETSPQEVTETEPQSDASSMTESAAPETDPVQTPEIPDTRAPSASDDTKQTPPISPSPYPLPELPLNAQPGETAPTDAQPGETQPKDNELETTVVRRKSLLGRETTETIAPSNPPSEVAKEPQWQPRPAELLGTDDPKLNEATVLAGASIKPAKISRAGAHFASLLTCVFALPFAWAFLKHANGLLYGAEHSTWQTGHYSVEGLCYLVLGLALIVGIGLVVRLSSLGSFVAGGLLTAAGFSFVVAPVFMSNFLDPTLTWLSESSIIAFRNLSYFLESSAFSGEFLAIGVALLMIGVVGHTARRRGRTDQIADKALAKVEGLQ